jgi:Tfp pilus assembly protein PilF
MSDARRSFDRRAEHQATLSRANDYLLEGQYAHAIAAYSEALRLCPSHAVVYLLRAIAYERSGDCASAEADRRHAERRAPEKCE